MFDRLTLSLAAGLFSASLVQAEEPVDLDMINRIVDEGYRNSQVMETLEHLTDTIGPRLTGSPQMTEANRWTAEKFEEWGYEAELQPFEFGRGWTYSKASVRLAAPRAIQLQAYPVPWTAGTDGPVSAEVVHAELSNQKDIDAFEGDISGKFVMIDSAWEREEPDNDVFARLETGDFDKDNSWNGPRFGNPYQRFASFITDKKAVMKFLEEQGAAGFIERSPRDGALIESQLYIHGEGETPAIPGVTLSSEDYNRVLRALEQDGETIIEMDIASRFHDEQPNAFNTIAEIRGEGGNPEIVMAGAHLDSWFVGDGAVDNGAGSAIIMEAARILAALDFQPKRTIRFALWSGEEQALYGSVNYVRENFGGGPAPEGDVAALPPFFWGPTTPVETKPDHDLLSAYFNIDNGSGKIRGIWGEGNMALQPIFEAWLKPFEEMGATEVVLRGTGGTDHLPFQWVGLPGFQFVQDPLDYGSRLHHTQIDTLDHVWPDDLKQASVILASFIYHAAQRDERLPRLPVPTE